MQIVFLTVTKDPFYGPFKKNIVFQSACKCFALTARFTKMWVCSKVLMQAFSSDCIQLWPTFGKCLAMKRTSGLEAEEVPQWWISSAAPHITYFIYSNVQFLARIVCLEFVGITQNYIVVCLSIVVVCMQMRF